MGPTRTLTRRNTGCRNYEGDFVRVRGDGSTPIRGKLDTFDSLYARGTKNDTLW